MKNSSNIRPVLNFENEELTFLCAGLGEMGWSTNAIAEETGLSVGQINYRLKLLNVVRSNYRNGSSYFARRMKEQMLLVAAPIVEGRAKKVRLL